jgi:hypothetical protein
MFYLKSGSCKVQIAMKFAGNKSLMTIRGFRLQDLIANIRLNFGASIEIILPPFISNPRSTCEDRFVCKAKNM